MIDKNIIYSHEGISSSYEDSEIVIFGIPFDGTVSFRPGTRFASEAIRRQLDGIETYSPYLDKDLADYQICDIGDMLLPFGNTTKVMEMIEKETLAILNDGKKMIALGGEHLVTYPIIKAYTQKYPNLNIIHFDAHADLRDEFVGEKLSHATVMRRAHEQLITGKLYQFGIRSGTKKEFEFAKENTYINMFTLENIEKAVAMIKDEPVYVSVDLDVLDPSIFPGTGTPEPGGVQFNELIKALEQLKNLNIVGSDIVELSPDYDASGVSTVVACKVLRELLLVILK